MSTQIGRISFLLVKQRKTTVINPKGVVIQAVTKLYRRYQTIEISSILHERLLSTLLERFSNM